MNAGDGHHGPAKPFRADMFDATRRDIPGWKDPKAKRIAELEGLLLRVMDDAIRAWPIRPRIYQAIKAALRGEKRPDGNT